MAQQLGATVGLSAVDARQLLTRIGPNAVITRHRVRLIRRIVNQLRDPLITVLLGAVFLTVGTGDFTDAVVIALVIIVNTTVGVIQEVRADRAISSLATLNAPRARVIRDGH